MRIAGIYTVTLRDPRKDLEGIVEVCKQNGFSVLEVNDRLRPKEQKGSKDVVLTVVIPWNQDKDSFDEKSVMKLFLSIREHVCDSILTVPAYQAK